MTKRIQIDDEIEQFLLAHAVDIGESPSDILRRVLGIAPPTDTIEVDDDVYRFIVSKAQSGFGFKKLCSQSVVTPLRSPSTHPSKLPA